MPTYHATGITATLATCDLQASCSNVIDLRQGAEQRTDEARVLEVFANAKCLPERVIGEDGGDRGVVQFLGVNEDMALFMVEAGEDVSRITHPIDDENVDEKMDVDVRPDSDMMIYGEDSPLTSLGATPTPTQQSFNGSPVKAAAAKNIAVSAPAAHTLKDILQSTRTILDSSLQALVLDIQLSEKSFLPPNNGKSTRGASLGKDLKVEVFINGELADVSFINARRSAASLAKQERVRFGGMRVHRQTEKPWVYVPSDKFATTDGSEVQSRWNSMRDSLLREAEARGRDKLGDLPPSAEFLLALSALDLPERWRGREGLGVVDVVVTAGKGRKYGPETFYITGPTRMEDPDYQVTYDSNIDPELRSPYDGIPLFAGMDSGSPFSLKPPQFHVPATSSPDVPLRHRTRNRQAILTGSPTKSPSPKKTTTELCADLGLDLDPKKISIEAYENAKGKIGRTRTLTQRLGDVKKMSEANQVREIERLREEFGIEGVVKEDSLEEDERVTKKMKQEINDNIIQNPGAGNFAHSPFDDVVGDGTIDPMLVFNAPPQLPQEDTDLEAVLTQNQIDMALSQGASPDGHLLRRIQSMSPQRTPMKKTKASALANSPTSVPVKAQTKPGPPKTPRRRKAGYKEEEQEEGSPFDSFTTPQTSMAKHAVRTPTRSGKFSGRRAEDGRGPGRSATKWIPTEKTASDVLRDFEVPEACVGSCVSYAEGEEAQRQIGKARRGEFREECLLVGMRFVVV